MRVDDLTSYKNIIIWGCGSDFQSKFKNQFHVTHIIDRDISKQGRLFFGVRVCGPEMLIDLKDSLIIVASSVYMDDISSEIRTLFPDLDMISLDEMLYITGQNRQNYCLWGIDTFVRDIFLRIGKTLSEITYVEIGCNHPFYGNATAAFYMAGASGVLVEPDQRFNHVINDLRPRDTLVNCGIGRKEGVMTFYKMDNSYRSSFDINIVRLNEKRGFRVEEEIEVPIRTLDWIMETYDVNPNETYISIPSMGHERAVLDGFNHDKYSVPIISVGINSDDVLKAPIFEDYKVIGEFPKHKVLARNDVWSKIME